MKRRWFWVAAAAVLVLVAGASVAAVALAHDGPGPVTDRGPDHARYHLNLESNDDGSRWTGTERVSFLNNRSESLRTVWVRLWGNGPDGCDDRAVRLSNPDGATIGKPSVGCTAVPVRLKEPVKPRREASIGFDVSIEVPEETDRFGRADDYNFLGNAVPLLAVKDSRGWQLPPYVSDGESFYSLASDFAVTLRHPDAVKVPATGNVTSETSHNGHTTTEISAHRVRDFAWAAGPFHHTTSTADNGVRLVTWFPDDVDTDTAKKVTGWARDSMEDFSDAYGQYPYREMDTVIGDWDGFGGMEYPSLIMSDIDQHDIVHETGHQWFYGLVGNDEYHDPWVDEAVNEYITLREIGFDGMCDNAPVWSSGRARIDAGMDYYGDRAREYDHGVYENGACMLRALRAEIGSRDMTRALARIVATYRYRIAGSEDLRSVFAEVSDRDLEGFWDVWRNSGP